MTRTIAVAGRSVGDGHPALIVAEMAWSHDGTVANALRIVEGAREAGADAVNVHVTSLPDYIVRHYGSGPGRVSAGHESTSVYDYLVSINLRNDDWERVFARVRELGLGLSVMVNDAPSLAFAAPHADLLMISAACFCDEAFVRSVARARKPVLIGIGGSTLGEVERGIGWLRSEGNDDVIIQYGFQSYPTRIEDVHLRYLETLKRTFGLPVSYGDHTDGADDMAITLPVAGVALGANVIEKHMTYDRSVKGEDFESALEPAAFRRMVDAIRKIETCMGSPSHRPLSPPEIAYRGVARKRAVAGRPARRGELLTREIVAYKRADAGLFPEECGPLLGRVLKEDLAVDDPLDWTKVV